MKTENKNINEVTLITGKTGHLQGIAKDEKRGFLYWSFTTQLIKTDMQGNVIGSVVGLIGHLGCIAFCSERDELWGTLELKNDPVGQGISKMLKRDAVSRDAFYAVVFDTEAITKKNINAENNNIMRACCLLDVCADYSAQGENGLPHRYGCSGIDGITFAPQIGNDDEAPLRMLVAYGIYGDITRSDNDDQIILSVDPKVAKQTAVKLRQDRPHRIGIRAEEKLFLRTGNTTYGIQNLEYDPFTDKFFAAVYPGKKPEFSNPPLFVFPRRQTTEATEGNCRRLTGAIDSYDFQLGSTGLASLGNGNFLVSESFRTMSRDAGKISQYRFTGNLPLGFEKV